VIVDERTNVSDVARDLALIGLDRMQGYFGEDVVRMLGDAEQTTSIKTAEMVELANSNDAVVIDVRNNSERQAGHVPGTIHIPLGELAARADELPRDQPIAVHCQGGGRAAIGASVLQSLGFEQVLHVKGGYTEWEKGSSAK
jgi:hydroxyacylglutathione hydrolase